MQFDSTNSVCVDNFKLFFKPLLSCIALHAETLKIPVYSFGLIMMKILIVRAFPRQKEKSD